MTRIDSIPESLHSSLMRCIAAILCVLYLSISTVVAGSHHHSPGSLDHGAKCAACAWHAETISDLPEVGLPIQAPGELIFQIAIREFRVFSSNIPTAPG